MRLKKCNKDEKKPRPANYFGLVALIATRTEADMERLQLTKANLIRLYAVERAPMKVMAGRFGVSKGTILNHVKRLAAKGEIAVRPRGRPTTLVNDINQDSISKGEEHVEKQRTDQTTTR